jgi:protein-S-isoprenylcysteine O-methyltransferase Ste14
MLLRVDCFIIPKLFNQKQVYIGKLLKRGTATKGLYVVIRHPQYVGLAFAALGLAIMWPRFLTLFLLAVMLLLYYILAKDEERRMIIRFGEGYASYMHRTGMLFHVRWRRYSSRTLFRGRLCL